MNAKNANDAKVRIIRGSDLQIPNSPLTSLRGMVSAALKIASKIEDKSYPKERLGSVIWRLGCALEQLNELMERAEYPDEIQKLRNALAFYANSDNYWSGILPLEIPYDRFTLKAVRAADKENKVLNDFGKLAREALGLEGPA